MRGIVSFGCALACSLNAAAQRAPASAASAAPVGHGTITGTVTDTSLRPVADADVNVIGTNSRLASDVNGRFTILEVPPGEFLVWVRRLGFHPVSSVVHVEPGDTLQLAYVLEPTLTELNPVVVTEKARSPRVLEFDERKKAGFGHFLTQAEIDKLNFVGLENVLRTFTSVRLEPKQQGPGYVIANARVRNCPMKAYVDGLPRGNDLDDLPSPKEIAGIEVYAGPATAPFGFGKPSCGLILIWTRDGG